MAFFKDYDTNEYFGVDQIKAYSSCLLEMAHFAVFNVFDQWLPYQREPIEDYSQYIIEIIDDLERLDIKILFTQRVSRCYGYKLNKIDNVKYKIYFVRKPSKLVKTNSADYLRKLYNNPTIDIKNKKFIINKNTGLIEKKHNSTTKAGIFKSLDDAHYYKNKFGGNVYYLRNCSEDEIGQYHDLTDDNEKLYLHKVADKKHLHEVFQPIKDFIYEIQTVKNYELYKTLRKCNVEIAGIKTDAFLIDKENLMKINNIQFINEKEVDNTNQFSTLGKCKLETNKTLLNKCIYIEHNDINYDLFKTTQLNKICLSDEYDDAELIEKTKKILIVL